MPGDSVTVTVSGVTNPADGSGSVGVVTSSDSDLVMFSDLIEAAQGVSNLITTLSPSVENATTSLTETFTTSSSGGLASGARGSVTLSGPTGITFPASSNDYRVLDAGRRN